MAAACKATCLAASGVAAYRVVFATVAAPASGAAGAMAFEGNALTFTHSGLSNQTSYGYRVCAIDRVGNVGVGVTALVQPRAEFNAPTGSVVINDGAAFTGSIAVTVAITATDASGIAFMCLSNTTAACTAFVPFSATTSFSLTNASGVRTVYVTLKDILGNVTTAPLTDTITLDVTAPDLHQHLRRRPAWRAEFCLGRR